MPRRVPSNQFLQVRQVSLSMAKAWRGLYAKCASRYFEDAYSVTKEFLSYTAWQVREEYGLAHVPARDPNERGLQILSSEIIANKAGLPLSTVNTMLAAKGSDLRTQMLAWRRTYLTVGRVRVILAGARFARRFSELYPPILARPCAEYCGWWREHILGLRANSVEIQSEYFLETGRTWQERVAAASGTNGIEKIKRTGRLTAGRIEYAENLKAYARWNREVMKSYTESGADFTK